MRFQSLQAGALRDWPAHAIDGIVAACRAFAGATKGYPSRSQMNYPLACGRGLVPRRRVDRVPLAHYWIVGIHRKPNTCSTFSIDRDWGTASILSDPWPPADFLVAYWMNAVELFVGNGGPLRHVGSPRSARYEREIHHSTHLTVKPTA